MGEKNFIKIKYTNEDIYNRLNSIDEKNNQAHDEIKELIRCNQEKNELDHVKMRSQVNMARIMAVGAWAALAAAIAWLRG